MPPWEHSSKRIAALALDGFAPLDLAVAVSVFAARRPNGEPLYSFVVCGPEIARVHGAYDFVIAGVRSLDFLVTADMIVVPGLTRDVSAEHRPALAALRMASKRGATILGIRRGVSVLAHAGLLDGRQASAGSEHACRLAERHPSIRIATDTSIVEDGGIVTCATPVAALDYCLHVVQSDWGAEVANELARDLLGTRRLGEQVNLAKSPSSDSAADAFARTLEWMRTNIHRPITISTAAARAHMSKRHFTRRFVEHTGRTPMQWLLTHRVLAARNLLSNSDLPVKQIAARVGFPSARALSEQFRLRTGTAPRAYRQTHGPRPL